MKTLTLTLADANLLHDVIPPRAGAHVGGGYHVPIPDDWEARVRAGQHVSGCTYYAPGAVDLTAEEEAIVAASADVRLVTLKTALALTPEKESDP